jgi:serine O-acetyltransferase
VAVPVIGNDCYIGPGAKLFGPIELGPNPVIGANAVVNRSFPQGNVTLVGVPAKQVDHDD